MSAISTLRVYLRKVSKAVFWLVTPWRMPMRLRFRRERAAKRSKAHALRLLIESEHARLRAIQQREPLDTKTRPLNLRDIDDATEAAGLPAEEILWKPVRSSQEVVDRASAAGFLLGKVRDMNLHHQFPFLLSAPKECGFLEWLNSDAGRSALGVTSGVAQHLVSLVASDYGGRARQFFLASEEIREVLPHGLMPQGRRLLFRWFMQHGLEASGSLTREEVWWLFFEADENPRGELVRAYRFTPDWQRRHPHALTVFGWSNFIEWVAATYGSDPQTVELPWVPPSMAALAQVRLAYFVEAGWIEAHPNAFSDANHLRALLEWLGSSDQANLSAEARNWCAELDVESVLADLSRPCVNVVGHFCYPSGLRVSVEAMTQAMRSAGISTSVRDMRTDIQDDPRHVYYDGLEIDDVTIIHVQPEPFFADVYVRADLAERCPRTYRIAYWYWEFDSIPCGWCALAEQVQEVWTATEFVARGLRGRLPMPVRTLFPGVALAPFQTREKIHFGLDPDRFTFLFTFHMVSVMERKNPLGLIRAFKMAFRPDEPVTLVLKTSFGDRHPLEFQELRDAAADMPSITIIDQVFSPEDVLSLMDACDAYVSLHRSEGLGLTMAEAMLMGKPVIATAFSGNMDFMNEHNSLLVPYERVKVGKPIPPYDAELEWAEPSTEHAAQFMRKLYEDRAFARELGARAKASAEVNLSLAAAGRRMADRLAEIKSSLHSRQ